MKVRPGYIHTDCIGLSNARLSSSTRLLRIAEEGQDIELPLVSVLTAMEIEGINLDVDFLKELSVALTDDINRLEKSIYEQAGEEFNIASPKQLGEVLFDKLQLDPKAKKTKTGQYQTGEDILSLLAPKHQIVQHILSFRTLQKLNS